MNDELTTRIWESAPFEKAPFTVLLALAHMADESGVCVSSTGAIAELARCSRVRAKEALLSLEASGWLVRERLGLAEYMYMVTTPEDDTAGARAATLRASLTTSDEIHQFISMDSGAEYAGCTLMTIRGLIERGEIRRYRIGRHVRIDRRELDSYMAGR